MVTKFSNKIGNSLNNAMLGEMFIPFVTQLTYTVSAVGLCQRFKLPEEEDTAVKNLLKERKVAFSTDSYVTVYPKLILHKQLLYSRFVKRVTKRNIYTVSYKNQGISQIRYGRIKKFVSISTETAEPLLLAIIKPLCVSPGAIADLNEDKEYSFVSSFTSYEDNKSTNINHTALLNAF